MRDDLVALTPDKLVALSNKGIVKRAQKQLARGELPAVQEEAGTVVARFEDATTRLEAGKTLAETSCSCGASSVCRHRVGAVLAYQATVSAPGDQPSPQSWSPSVFDDEALVAALGSRVVAQARAQVTRGLVIGIRRVAGGDSVPTASLPTCTVRFLIPEDLAYARCDCTAGERCAHVALAVWAYRRADAEAPLATEVSVELGGGRGPAAHDASKPALDLCRELLLGGVVHAGDQLGGRFEQARRPLEEAKQQWLVDVVDELQGQLDAYRARSARYRPDLVATLVTELFARSRAARRGGALPSSVILGANEAPETRLDQLRLVSLGARLFADGDARDVEVYLADPDTATVLVLRKHLAAREGEPPAVGDELASRAIGPRIRLGTIARGQLVTALARRRANRELILGRGTVGKTSLTLQSGEWDSLPEPLLVRDYADLRRRLAGRPPRIIDNRVLAANVHALSIHGCGSPRYEASEQRLSVTLRDRGGNELLVVAEHRHVAAHALPALAAALQGKHGTPRFIAGEVALGTRGLILSPTSVVCDRVVALDLASAERVGELAELDKEAGIPGASQNDLAEALDALDQLVHRGLARVTPQQREAAARTAARLERIGLRRAASEVSRLAELMGQGTAHTEVLTDAFVRASIRLRVTATTL